MIEGLKTGSLFRGYPLSVLVLALLLVVLLVLIVLIIALILVVLLLLVVLVIALLLVVVHDPHLLGWNVRIVWLL